MPVEIRELVIKTNIVSDNKRQARQLRAEELEVLKRQVVDQCLKALQERSKKSSFER